MPQSIAADAHVLPIIGEIAAGGPIEAYQDASESMAVPDLLAPSGDATSCASGRFDDQRPHPGRRLRPDPATANGSRRGHRRRPGGGELRDLEAVLQGSGRIRLQPANPDYPAMFYNDVRIQGKLIGVIRRLD